MNRRKHLKDMHRFSKPFDARDYTEKVNSLAKSSHSLSFHDREDIRRRLAMDSDGEEILSSSSRASRKSSLITRLQSGQSLQICFLNENVTDFTSQESDDHCEDDVSLMDTKTTNTSLDNSHITTEPNNVKTSPNNNSCQDITNSFKSLDISQPKTERPSHLFTKLGFGSLNFDKYDVFAVIPKPSEKEKFRDYHSRLHAEARLALAQVKEIVKQQIEVERHIVQIRSPIYNLINIPIRYKLRKNKFSKSFLSNMSVSQLQLIVNDMYSQIESLNAELVQLLIRRDELYMEQDSVLVDIEDLTIFLCSKQSTVN